MDHAYSYLALGDSYTVGEGVAVFDSFPYRTVQLLRNMNIVVQPPQIIAKSGWTTEELLEHIAGTNLKGTYDFVTLLIGANNQYRGLSASDYARDFAALLQIAVTRTGDDAKKVYVLPIPDWGLSPFASTMDTKKISSEISQFNSINLALSGEYQAHYISLPMGVPGGSDFAADGLHPSAAVYQGWAVKLAETLAKSIC